MEHIAIYLKGEYFLLSLLIAATGFVYTNILTQPGQIFHKWYLFLAKVFRQNQREELGLAPDPFFNVLIHCEKCVSGQMMLWMFFILNYNTYLYDLRIIIPHILFVGFNIFLVEIIKQLYTKYLQ